MCVYVCNVCIDVEGGGGGRGRGGLFLLLKQYEKVVSGTLSLSRSTLGVTAWGKNSTALVCEAETTCNLLVYSALIGLLVIGLYRLHKSYFYS